jgi:hypothetical protein
MATKERGVSLKWLQEWTRWGSNGGAWPALLGGWSTFFLQRHDAVELAEVLDALRDVRVEADIRDGRSGRVFDEQSRFRRGIFLQDVMNRDVG